MQDEIVARLASALHAQLVAAEARRAEQSSNPDFMDLYFQGLAWINRGRTADNVARARGFFDRALAGDPGNVDALVGSAHTNIVEAAHLLVGDPAAAFAAAETKLTKALSSVPDHAFAHALLGFLRILTRRAAEGIAECEHALVLDQNLTGAHFASGVAKVFLGRAEETEAHIAEGLRLSPLDTMAYLWMTTAGSAKLHLGSHEEAIAWFRRAIEANRNNPAAFFNMAAALAQIGRLEEARSAARAGFALNPAYTVSRRRASWMAQSDDPTYLAQLVPILEGLRRAGVPED